jgi:hypothetical protein
MNAPAPSGNTDKAMVSPYFTDESRADLDAFAMFSIGEFTGITVILY